MKTTYWGFCNFPTVEGRVARGFVLASSVADATTKARKRVTVERRRIGRKLKTLLEPVPQRGRYRVRVWKDPEMTTAPSCKHYVERRGTV
jgi:hypothetical protein